MNGETWSNIFIPTSRWQFFNGKLTDTCPHPQEIKKDILSRDRDLRLAQYEGRADMSTVVEVERAIGWPRLWDLALDHGPKCIDGLRNLVRVITFPPHALSACPLCEEEDISRDALLSHVLTTHSRSPCNSDKLLSLLLSVADSDSVLFNYLCSLANLF